MGDRRRKQSECVRLLLSEELQPFFFSHNFSVIELNSQRQRYLQNRLFQGTQALLGARGGAGGGGQVGGGGGVNQYVRPLSRVTLTPGKIALPTT